MLYNTLGTASQLNVNHLTDYNFDITKISVEIVLFLSKNVFLSCFMYLYVSDLDLSNFLVLYYSLLDKAYYLELSNV